MSETRPQFTSHIVYMPDGAHSATDEDIVRLKHIIEEWYNSGYRFQEAIDLYALSLTVLIFQLEDARAAEPR